MSKVQIVWFRDLVRWDTEYFTGNHRLESKFKLVDLSEILTPRKERIKPNEYDGITPIVAKIPFSTPNIELRKEPKTRMDMYAVYKNDLLVSNINFHQGAVAICRENKVFASTHYQPYIVNTDNIDLEFLVLVLRQNSYQQYISAKKIRGIKTESNFNFIKTLQIPLPPIEIQKQIVAKIESIKAQIKALQEEEKRLKDEIEAYIYIALGLEKKQEAKRQKVFIIRFKDLDRWDTRHNQSIAINLCHTDSTACHTEAIAEVSTNIESKRDFDTLSLRGEAKAIHNPQNNIKADFTESMDCHDFATQNLAMTGLDLKALLDSIPTPPPHGWEQIELGQLLSYERPDAYIVGSENYNNEYKIPVLTAGKTFILGYTDEINNIYKDVPVIIFDDFTTATQFVDFEFKVKSSAMKILKNRNDKVSNIRFVFYAMQTIKLNLSLALRRYWISMYKDIKIPLPPLSVQEKIVNAIEMIKAQIAIIDSKLESLETRKAQILESALSEGNERERERTDGA